MSTPTSCTRWLGARWVLSLFALLLLALPSAVKAQGTSSDQLENSAGTLYVVAFPDTTKNTFDARYPNQAYTDKAILFIYSAVDTKVTVKGRGYNNTFTTVGGTFKTVELMGGSGASASAPIVFEHCKPVDNTFRLESDAPIVVYQYLVTKFGTEAWTPIPVEAWGTEYYAAAKEGEIGSDVSPGGEFDYNRKNKMFPAEILVIAAYDDTRITIVPNGQVLNFCRAENVMLKAGEAYQIQAYVDTLTANIGGDQPDFGGSRIFSTKPVGVISGNTRAQTIDENVGLGKNIFKNMLIEWLAPVEQHGTEFVYMPTWDARRPTGAPNEDPSEKRKAEFVRIYASSEEPTIGYFMQGGVPVQYDAPIDAAKWAQIRHTPNLARVHRTDKPAQAMMHSAAVVKYAGTTQGFGGYIGAAYDGWGGYMVELTPREQWVEFAPYYASSHPGGMEHFINVVTDTNHMRDVYMKNGSNFIFQRRIEGTDLIWGSMSVQQGIDNYLEGRNGAKFAGFVYGGLAKGGHEEYRPGRVKEQDDDNAPGLANRGNTGDESQPLHPSEYEEYLAIAYGYPLAPSRLVVGPGDSLGIKTKVDCFGMTVEIESLNENPVGLRSVRLDNADNAKITSQNPFPLTGAVKATIRIQPINPQANASATIVIKDKTGKTTRLPFTYFAERVDVDKTALNFGIMTPGTPGTMQFTVKNPLGRAIVLEKSELIVKNPAFTIKSPTSFPITIAPGDSITVVVEANPSRPDQAYNDTVLVKFGCAEVKVPVLAETSDPCVQVGDLDFGTLQVGESAVRTLRISNDGGGIVTFNNPSGGALIEWLNSMFDVAPSEMAKLTSARLARGEFVDIVVRFTATETGEFRDTARIWASVRKCRDISYWIARVTSPGPQITGYDWEERWIVKGACSPAEAPNGTKNQTPEYVSEVYVFNTGTASFDVDRVELQGPDAIYFQLDNSDPLKTIKRDDRILPLTDTVLLNPKYFQRVKFFPGSDERPYSCDIVLFTKDGRQVKNTLHGIGIESHLAAPATTDFGRNLFVPGAPGIPMTVTFRTENLAGLGSRPVTISGVSVVPANPGSAGQFTIMNAGAIVGATFPQRSTIDVIVEYAPTAAADHMAEIVLTGDFSPCDDSTATVVGKAYTLNSYPHGTAYGTLLTCFDKTQDVSLENDGSDTIVVYDVNEIGDVAGVFNYTPATLPDTLAPGESLVIPVTFAPNATGTFTGTFEFDVRDLKGVTPVLFGGNPVVANVSGSGEKAVAKAHIDRTYKGLPGSRYDVEVKMDTEIPAAQIDQLDFSLRYAHGMMQHEMDLSDLSKLVAGTILDGWNVDATPAPMVDPADKRQSIIYLKLTAPPGKFLTGTGTMLKIPFVTFIGDTTSTELPFFLTPVSRLACADIVTDPGAAAMDSVCGLNFRLISAFGTDYALRQNSPNPFNPSTEIRFSLGLDDQTTLKVYDAKGSLVATLVNAYLTPGEYTVTWDASSMPSGLYYYRLESGKHWSRTESMILQK
jgi:hypothetical protein